MARERMFELPVVAPFASRKINLLHVDVIGLILPPVSSVPAVNVHVTGIPTQFTFGSIAEAQAFFDGLVQAVEDAR